MLSTGQDVAQALLLPEHGKPLNGSVQLVCNILFGPGTLPDHAGLLQPAATSTMDMPARSPSAVVMDVDVNTDTPPSPIATG